MTPQKGVCLLSAFYAALFGILEGVTEWLPISSTGHLILLERILVFPVRTAFFELFEVAIQLAAIGAVSVLYRDTLNPFARKRTAAARRDTWRLWGLVLLATLPSAVIGLLLDDFLDKYLFNPTTVACALIFYGIAFILLEKRQKLAPLEGQITKKTALSVGLFQALALVPGTSRSGATMLGGTLSGLSRTRAAEFSFFLGIPTMLGASALKGVKFFWEGNALTREELLMLAVGMAVSFLSSLAVIRFLLGFVRRHGFAWFGVYRIALGAAVLLILT